MGLDRKTLAQDSCRSSRSNRGRDAFRAPEIGEESSGSFDFAADDRLEGIAGG
jgi:hypothetical protein